MIIHNNMCIDLKSSILLACSCGICALHFFSNLLFIKNVILCMFNYPSIILALPPSQLTKTIKQKQSLWYSYFCLIVGYNKFKLKKLTKILGLDYRLQLVYNL